MATIQSLWEDLEKWYNENTGHSLNLRKGASEEEISKAEKKMNITFPADFREHLLLHDGQKADTIAQWLPGLTRLLPLKDMVIFWGYDVTNADEENEDSEEKFEDSTDLDDHIFNGRIWHPKRIPISGNEEGDGDSTYLDLIPGPKGNSGQLITRVDECSLALLGNSFKHALERYLEGLKKGDLIWHIDDDGEEFVWVKNKELDNEQSDNFALISPY